MSGKSNNRVVYTRENKPRFTLAAAYIIRERNYLYEYKLHGQDKPRLEKAVNVDFVRLLLKVGRDVELGTWGIGDSRTRGRGDVGTWGLGDVKTRGRGDAGTRGLKDVGTWGLGDVKTRGRGDAGTRGLKDVGTRGRGDSERWDARTSELADAWGFEDVINK